MAIPEVSQESPSPRIHDAAKFCPTDPRFRHCGIHIRWVTLLASVLQLAAISYELASAYVDSQKVTYESESPTRASRLVHTDPLAVGIWGGVYMLCTASALAAIARSLACLLLPQLAAQSLTIIIASLDAFLLLANMGNSALRSQHTWLLLVVSLVVTLMESYFLWLGIRCYWYLRDFTRFSRDLTATCATNRRTDGADTEGTIMGRYLVRFVDFVSSRGQRSNKGGEERLPDPDWHGSRVCLLGKEA